MQPGDGLRSRPAHPAGSGVQVVEAVLQALQRHDPSTPARHSIELIETHFAWIFLTAAYAYKLKKAVYLLGAAPVAQLLLETYRRRTNDIVSGRLFGFYRSHRATTRAKIVAWHVRDPTCRDREPWLERASKYVALAIEALECATDQ